VTAKRAQARKKRDAFATRIGSHAGAWEPEKINDLCPRHLCITMSAPAWERSLDATAKWPASEQKRDAFATQIGSHAGAWEPENGPKHLTNQSVQSPSCTYDTVRRLFSTVQRLSPTLLSQ